MDWVRFGRGIRALRLQHAWRQEDLGKAARLSQSIVSRVERGLGGRVNGDSLERMASALGARLIVRLDWNGEAMDRLLDSAHAGLVDQVVARLRSAGWVVVPEATFAIGLERGSVDVLVWHAASATLLVVEVKSVVPDVQATLVALDRKVRLSGQLAAAQGWRPLHVGRALVIGDSRTSRRRVELHAATFEVRFPDRGAAVRRFIASPESRSDPFGGLWFLPSRTGAPTRHRVARRPSSRRA